MMTDDDWRFSLVIKQTLMSIWSICVFNIWNKFFVKAICSKKNCKLDFFPLIRAIKFQCIQGTIKFIEMENICLKSIWKVSVNIGSEVTLVVWKKVRRKSMIKYAYWIQNQTVAILLQYAWIPYVMLYHVCTFEYSENSRKHESENFSHVYIYIYGEDMCSMTKSSEIFRFSQQK